MDYKRTDSGYLIPNYKLLTAEITYHMPDHPHLLQVYVWQEFDTSPDFPHLKKFLDFWRANLEGKLHSVIVNARDIVDREALSYSNGHFMLH